MKKISTRTMVVILIVGIIVSIALMLELSKMEFISLPTYDDVSYRMFFEGLETSEDSGSTIVTSLYGGKFIAVVYRDDKASTTIIYDSLYEKLVLLDGNVQKTPANMRSFKILGFEDPEWFFEEGMFLPERLLYKGEIVYWKDLREWFE